MKVGRVLRVFRIVNDYTVKQMADALDVASSYVCDIESLRKSLSYKTLEKYAKVFNVSPSTILKIHEFSEENNGVFKKTLLEVVKIYVSE